MGNITNKIKQQKYRDDLKAQDIRMVNLPIPNKEIELAMQLTGAEKERHAILAIFRRGLEKQRDLLDNSVTSNELIAAINHEREKLQREILADYLQKSKEEMNFEIMESRNQVKT